jgi:GPH family glycoside/pentoside/hexuronide:cation symporter
MSKALGKLTLSGKVGYGLGDFASVLFWQNITMNLMFFYTDVFKISTGVKAAVIAGAVIGFSRFFDVLIDPVIGMVADRTETRWGKFRPYLIWMAVPLAIAAILMFSTPHYGVSGKILYAYITIFLFMLCYAGINIPYSSLLGVLTPDPIARTSASSFKFAFAFIAGTTVSLTSLILAKHLGNGVNTTDPGGWQKTIAIYGGVAIVFFVLTFLLTKERVKPPKAQRTSVIKDVKDLFSNVPWIILLFATICMIMFVSTRIGVTNYYFKYYITSFNQWATHKITYHLFNWSFNWGFEEVTTVFNSVGQACSVIGALLVPFLVTFIGKKNAFFTLFGIAIISTAAFYFFTPNNLTLIFILQITGSLTGGPLSPVIWAMYADTADYSEWKNKRRATGLVFSASASAQKIGWTIGAVFTGALLTGAGFIANKAQTVHSNHMLISLMSMIPSIFGILSVILVFFYKLDEKTMKKIETDLIERRLASGESVEN